jgi:biotin transport system substrate-specific component
VAGGLGVNWFAGRQDGWGGATFGYVVGFVAAATLVGWLAQRGGDRTVTRTAVTMVLGNLVIYAVGVPWLMASTGMDLATALDKGVVPFLLGDAIKVLAAAGLFPAAWALVKRVEKR